MSRGGRRIKKRKIIPDPVYKNALVAKFINRVMRNGKKTTAQRVVYGAFEILRQQGHEPLKIFEAAIDRVGPRQEVKARRIGGAAYQVPTDVRGERRMSLAVRWILEASAKRSSREFNTFSKKLATELLDASNNAGEAIRKRDISHRMAEANKAFAHFRW